MCASVGMVGPKHICSIVYAKGWETARSCRVGENFPAAAQREALLAASKKTKVEDVK